MDLYLSIEEDAPVGTSLAVAATAGSFTIVLSATPTIYSIYKMKSTQSLPLAPYFMMLWCMSSYVAYGIILMDFPSLISQTFGTFAAIFYISVYAIYASKGQRKLLVVLIVLSVFHFMSLIYFTYKNDLFALTIIAGVCNLLFYFSPLFKLVTVCRTRSVAEMPLPLTLGVFFSSLVWFIYSYMVAGLLVVWILAIIGIFFGLIQIFCYCLFYKSSTSSEEIKEPKVVEVV